ncbi:dihydroxyacetone kinase phosphoryl donor subunit DhaM [Lentzea sp. NPDC006480]|uniref:dihydroxyacetone kinase phosphoryl donor subunit DhaM n=1 Tax=Lentzea sp. NPDC006480 TaxID=3157176 RepID=UPI0033A7982E
MQPVGIVLVSHSAELASGLRALLDQLGVEPGSVIAAGGTADGRIGTSYDAITAAVKEADQGSGVVVLPDLGSAVITARAVLADYAQDDVVLVDAPFVEGAVAAAVTAAGGADLATVITAAREARHATKL